MTFITDTHALVWFIEGNRQLSIPARNALADPRAEIVIPTIVLVEVLFLYSKKRIKVELNQIRSQIINARNCTVYPLDEEVVSHIPLNLDIHDAIICATAIVFRDLLGHEVKIVTKDEAIIKAGIVETVW